MQEHVAYWADLMGRGLVLIFGPVADPAGPYGIGIVRIGDAAAARGLADNDPAFKADVGFGYEVYPMPGAVSPAVPG